MLCPICKKPVKPPNPTGEKSYYPFCSDRCKLIDLGRWLGGKYQVPLQPEDPPTPSRRTHPADDSD